MGKVLVLLLLLLSAVTFASAYVRTDTTQRSAMQQAAVRVGRPFAIPDDPRLAEPERVYPALLAAARAAQVNVYRVSAGYTSADEPQTTTYALLTGPTRLWQELPLDRGGPLSASDTQSSNRFLATTSTADADQVGVLHDFGGNDLVSVRALQTAFVALPVAGYYQVEAPREYAYTKFLHLFAQEVTRGGGGSTEPLADSVFTGGSGDFRGVAADSLALLTAVRYLIIFLTAMLLAYRMLYEAKRAAVMKLHGFGTTHVWWAVTGRLVVTVMAAATLVAVLAAAAVHDSTAGFVGAVAVALAQTAAVMLVVSLVTCLYISRIKISDSVKNRKDTRGIFAFNTVVKVVTAVLLVTVGAGLWGQYRNVDAERAKLGNWSKTKDYGVFYPSGVGNDLVEAQTGQVGPTAAEAYDLYPVLDRMGSLFVDASAYEPEALATPTEPGTFRSMQVNPNYLRAYPLRDATGQVVDIAENTTDWVVLAPAAYKPRQAQLLEYFQRGRTGTRTQQGAVQAEQMIFGRPAPPRLTHQHIRIVWLADGQNVFSFNPAVSPGNGNLVTDPILQVMTLANSLGIDRANAITGGSDTALKVRLRNADTAATQQALAPTLRDLRLDDNLRHLVTMSEYALLELQHLQEGVRNVAIAAAALFVGMLVLITQSLTIVFDRYSRKIVVRRLFGLGFRRTYREFLRLFGVIAVAQTVGAVIANAAGLSPFSTATSSGAVSPMVVLGVSAAVVAVELIFSTAALTVIEKRNIVRVLKGEF